MNKIYHGFSHCSGVYKITNIENGDVYFGQAAQLGTRAQQHEGKLIAGAEGRVNEKGKLIKHDNRYLQAAWNKYKSDAFEFEVIAVYPDKDERDAAEQALIDEHYGPGCYNLAPKVAPAKGTWSHTPEESSAKLSAAKKGNNWNKGKKYKPWTQGSKDAKSAAMTGRKLSPEHCANMGASKKGKKYSAEHCAAIGAAMKGIPRPPRTPEHSAAAKAASEAAWVKRRAKALLVDNLDEQ